MCEDNNIYKNNGKVRYLFLFVYIRRSFKNKHQKLLTAVILSARYRLKKWRMGKIFTMYFNWYFLGFNSLDCNIYSKKNMNKLTFFQKRISTYHRHTT